MSAPTPPPADNDPTFLVRLTLRIVLGSAFITALLVLPSGSWAFWPAWLFLVVLLGPMLAVTFYFLRHDRALLRRRMESREVEPTQRMLIAISAIVCLGGFILPGLDFRYGWSTLPVAVILAANLCVFLGYLTTFWVLKTNSYAARTIRVETDQKVIDTGPYARVRHPMYTGVMVMMLASPIALGSLAALPVFLLIPPLLVGRILNEEKVLREQLAGYTEYCERVPYRLVPGLW